MFPWLGKTQLLNSLLNNWCSNLQNSSSMIGNYFLLAFRNLLKQRGYALVNIFGLAVGLGAAMYIMLYVRDELTFDRMHPNAENLYRIGMSLQLPNGEVQTGGYSPAGWDNYIKSNYEGIDAITSFIERGMPTSIHYIPRDKIVLTEDILWAEPSITEILSMPVVKGAAANPLKEINSMMLTESAARNIFGDEDPIGKMLTVSNMFATNNQKVEMMVTALIKDFPSNTHVDPKYIFNIFALKPFNENLESRLNSSMGNSNDQFWSSSFFVCSDEKKIATILTDLQKKANEIDFGPDTQFKFTPLVRKITDVHFDKDVMWSTHKSVDIKYIFGFITIAFLILMVACINYINLATAKAGARGREIGLRKTFGGIRQQLFFQFMMESFVLVVLSASLAILLVILLMPQFNTLTQKVFSYVHVFNTEMLLIIGAVVLTVTIMAGSYPALFVSGFQPAAVLKGKFAFGKGPNIFRQVLTTIQFGVAVILLSGTFIVVNQMDLMRYSKLNEAGNQIVSVRYGGFTGPATDAQYRSYKSLILQDPQIEDVTLANHLPRQDNFPGMNMKFKFPDFSDQEFDWFQINGDYNFPQTFNLKIIAGRTFDPGNVADTMAILLNESSVRTLNTTPEEIIGKEVIRPVVATNFGQPDSTQLPVHGIVIGVIEDFPFRSANYKIDPLGIAPKPHVQDRIIYVRLPAEKMGQKIADLEQKWKQVFPNYGFDYWFIDYEFGRMYENEVRVAALTEKFSWLAILVACVGLYGLAAFMAEQRTKEIGIRKTMGASNSRILWLLLKVFGKLLLIASIIGVPLTYLLSRNWLENFVYRTPLSATVFVGALLVIALITLITVGYETLKAAMANPINAIRHEG
jgi:putative ABC transport system permease protein